MTKDDLIFTCEY